jgi:hypothetical protein
MLMLDLRCPEIGHFTSGQLGTALQYDIFISYSGRDREWAVQLYRRLRRFKIEGRRPSIFFAPAAVHAGESIPRAVSEALDNSRHLLMVMSRAWLSSEWCRLEQETALWGDPANSDRVLLPLLLENCNLPPSLRRLQHIDFTATPDFESSLRLLVKTLRTTTSRSQEAALSIRQRDAILNEPILPWLGFNGPSFDFLWPEMIIDPFITTRKHPGPNRRLSEWLSSRGPAGASSIAIIGEPGVGKTTALRSLMLSREHGLVPHRRVLMHARDLSNSLESVVSTAKDSSNPFGVIVDGLDEAGSERAPEIADALRQLNSAGISVFIGSRTDFFDRQYRVLRGGLSNLIEVVELSTWQDNEILGFTGRYAERVGHPGLSAMVRDLLSRVRGARGILGNPMRLTLLLYLLARGTNVSPVNLQEPYSLYDTFYREWLHEERGRGTGGFDLAGVRRAHIEIAHWLNQHKGEIATLSEMIEEVDYAHVETLLADSAFSGLLALSDHDEGGGPTVSSFRHETIGEFLVAHDILGAFGGPVDSLRRALRDTVGHDINEFVRSGFRVASPATIRKYLSNLTAIYNGLLPAADGGHPGQHGFGHEQAERMRQQIIYYIGRMPASAFPEVLRRAFREERVPLLRRAAALGAVLQGDFMIEREYMTLLEDPPEALLNRSVQLAYFGDVEGDLYTFIDEGQDWPRCRSGIYGRFGSTSERDVRLRWWDLRTLRSFYSSRGYRDVLSDFELTALLGVSLVDPASESRSAAMRSEHQLLLRELGLDS